MPLRDHFHPPLDDRFSWDVLHGGWPMIISLDLNRILPPRYVAGPQIHLGSQIEVDIGTHDTSDSAPAPISGNGAAYAPAAPSVVVETDLLSTDEYEVRIFDTKRHRRLVAAIEIVSPSNKDRDESREVFVAKCEAMLRKGISVAIVDLVTARHFNLYTELLDLIDRRDPTMGDEPPAIYAAACRWIERRRKRLLECWSHPLVLGQPLPTLPLWLSETYSVPLELEATYEEACHGLRIA